MSAKFFIVGTGRCGTELVMRLLDSHPAVLVLNESMFLLPCLRRYGRRQVDAHELVEFALSVRHVDGQSTLRHALSDAGISDSAQSALLGNLAKLGTMTAFELLDAIGRAAAETCGKAHWAEKVPDAGYFVAEIAQQWPEALFIHVFRDGYHTARSMERHAGFRANIVSRIDTWVDLAVLPYSADHWAESRPLQPDEFLALWGRRLLFIEEQLSTVPSSHVMRVSFERLLSHPQQELCRICARLGLDIPPEWPSNAAAIVDSSRSGSSPDPEILEDLYCKAPSARQAMALVTKLLAFTD